MTGLGGLSVWSILHTKRPVKPKFHGPSVI